MWTKSCTSILFLLIFSGKVLALDAALPVIALNSLEVKLVKPYCKKKQGNHFGLEHIQKSHPKKIQILNIHCNPVSYNELPVKSVLPAPSNYKDYTYKDPSISSVFISKFHPPPKVGVI